MRPNRFSDAGVYRGAHFVGFGHVADVHDAGAAFLLDQRARFVGGRLIAVGCEYLGALTREQDRSGLAVAPAGPDAACARDECDLAFQVQHVCPGGG